MWAQVLIHLGRRKNGTLVACQNGDLGSHFLVTGSYVRAHLKTKLY